jgi:hypothetical protein
MGIVNLDVGVGDTVRGIMEGLDGLFTSDDERAAAALAIQTQLQKPHIMQALANIEAAKHSNWFVAGSRPALMWVCVLGLAYSLLVHPFAALIAHFAGLPSDLPPLDADVLMTLTMALLGLGGLRTVEKIRGVARTDNPVWKPTIGPIPPQY